MSPRSAAAFASCGQRRPVAPLSDAGLTRKTTAIWSGRGGRERDARHPVDRRAELVVRDPLELSLDDDVAHRQQRGRVHVAQRAEREQHRGFHLHGEHAALDQRSYCPPSGL